MNARRTTHARFASRIVFVACALMVSMASLRAHAAPPRSPAETLGRLQVTPVELHIENLPMRDAFRLLSAAIETPILLRDDPSGGFSGDIPVTIKLNEPITTLDALEMLIDMTALGEDATWQLRTGFIEVGTKRVLARAGLIETRIYDITDFRLQAIYSQGGAAASGAGGSPIEQLDFAAFHEHRYRSAHVAERPAAQSQRKSPIESARELMRLIVGVVEPGNWNLPADFEDLGWLTVDPAQSNQLPTHASRDPVEAVGRLRLDEGRALAVRAPDFMQRAIAGYPDPIVPAPISADALERRATRATQGSSSIRPHATTRDEAAIDRPTVPSGLLAGRSGSLPPTHRELVHQLRNATVTLEVADRPLRQVLEAWSIAANVPVLGRFHDDPVGHGLDPDQRITLHLQEQSAIAALEAIIGEATGFSGRATWQIRHGFIEVGTKARLSVPAAREIRIYPIADIRMMNRLNSPREVNAQGRVIRPVPEAETLDVLAEVVEKVEPGTWDFGQPLISEEGEPHVVPEMPGDDVQAPRAPDPVYQPLQMIASIRAFRDLLIVNAPDYYHRQIGGYDTDQSIGQED